MMIIMILLHHFFSARNPLDMEPSVETKPLPSVVNVNEEVLSRFTDDGWYYRSMYTTITSKDFLSKNIS